MTKNWFDQVKPHGYGKDGIFFEHHALALMNLKKELYQTIETAALDDYQQQKQLKGLAHVTRIENNVIC